MLELGDAAADPRAKELLPVRAQPTALSGLRFARQELPYASPERLLGRELGASADIYSLGAVLYEMLTGTPPFTDGPAVRIAACHIAEPPERPLLRAPDARIPEQIEAEVMRALAKPPSYRHQTIAELAADLRTALSSSSTVPPPSRETMPPPSSVDIDALVQKTAPGAPPESAPGELPLSPVAPTPPLESALRSAAVTRRSTPDASELVGTTVAGRYRLAKLIGKGQSSLVFRASVVNSSVELAVKLCYRHRALDAALVGHLLQLSALGHPGIARVLDAGRLDDGTGFVATELLHGESLAERLSRGPLAPLEAIAILEALAEALSVTHAAGHLHLAIKPANVFLLSAAQGPKLKLLDFAVAPQLSLQAGALEEPVAAELPLAERVAVTTLRAQMLGTPGYAAPEQVRGAAAVGARTDVYALGICSTRCSSASRRSSMTRRSSS